MDEEKVLKKLTSAYRNLSIFLSHIEKLVYSLFLGLIILIIIISSFVAKVMIEIG